MGISIFLEIYNSTESTFIWIRIRAKSEHCGTNFSKKKEHFPQKGSTETANRYRTSFKHLCNLIIIKLNWIREFQSIILYAVHFSNYSTYEKRFRLLIGKVYPTFLHIKKKFLRKHPKSGEKNDFWKIWN